MYNHVHHVPVCVHVHTHMYVLCVLHHSVTVYYMYFSLQLADNQFIRQMEIKVMYSVIYNKHNYIHVHVHVDLHVQLLFCIRYIMYTHVQCIYIYRYRTCNVNVQCTYMYYTYIHCTCHWHISGSHVSYPMGGDGCNAIKQAIQYVYMYNYTFVTVIQLSVDTVLCTYVKTIPPPLVQSIPYFVDAVHVFGWLCILYYFWLTTHPFSWMRWPTRGFCMWAHSQEYTSWLWLSAQNTAPASELFILLLFFLLLILLLFTLPVCLTIRSCIAARDPYCYWNANTSNCVEYRVNLSQVSNPSVHHPLPAGYD